MGQFGRRRLIELAALLFSALVLGGGGPHAPALTGLIEGIAIIVLLRTIVRGDARAQPGAGAIGGTVLIALLLILGAVQLVPLPPWLWQALPGRGMLAEALPLLGRAGAWWPVSFSPPDTRSIILSWLPPVALFVAVAPLPVRDRIVLVKLVVIAGAASALLGIAQLVMGDGSLFPYGLPPFDRYPGLFANFNHQAALLSCCAVLAVTLWLTAERGAVMARRLPVILLVAILYAGVLITSSRAGLALLALSALGIALLCRTCRSDDTRMRRTSSGRAGGGRTLIIIAAGVTLLVVGALFGSYRSTLMLDRFGSTADDARFTFWPTVLSAIRLYFPIGSGLGTFDLVYEAVEPLDAVQNYTVNHAHNDYLEWVLETGAAGLALLAGFFVWLYRRIGAAVRLARSDHATLARAGAMTVGLILLHSVVDYPLRTEAIGCLFAFACALLVAPPGARAGAAYTRSR